MDVAPLPPSPPAPDPALPRGGPKAEETARAFEAVFLGQLAQLMLESVEPGEFSGGHGETMFRGVLAEQLGQQMAKRGGIGLAPAVLEQIIKLQEGNGDGR